MAKGLVRSQGRALPGTEAGFLRVTYPIKNVSVTIGAAAAGPGIGTVVIGDFPKGDIVFVAGVSSLSLSTADTDFTATYDGSYSVGTTADADGTLAGTEVNLIASSTIAAATARVSNNNRGSGATPAVFNNTDNSLEVNLNIAIDAADVTDAQSGTFVLNGFVTLFYATVG